MRGIKIFLVCAFVVLAIGGAMAAAIAADKAVKHEATFGDQWDNWGSSVKVALMNFWQNEGKKDEKHIQWFGVWDKDKNGDTHGCCSLAVMNDGGEVLVWVRTSTDKNGNEDGATYALSDLASLVKASKVRPRSDIFSNERKH